MTQIIKPKPIVTKIDVYLADNDKSTAKQIFEAWLEVK